MIFKWVLKHNYTNEQVGKYMYMAYELPVGEIKLILKIWNEI